MTLTAGSGAWTDDGKVSRCFDFDGSASAGDTNLSSTFSSGNNITVCGWVYLDVVNVTQRIIGDFDSATSAGWSLLYVTGTGFRADVQADGSNYKRTVASSDASASTWYFLVAQFYGDGSQPKLYINNV